MTLVTLFRFIEVEIDAPGGATLTFYTDLPGDAQAVRATAAIPATVGRHPYRLTLSGSCKGKLYVVKIVPIGTTAARIYSAKVYARTLGGPTPTPWAWYVVPVLDTPDDWQPVKLPIPVTSDDWVQLKLPIPATSDDWEDVHLPIPATSSDWAEIKLPIPATSDDWSEIRLPVKSTPPVPEWLSVPVDL